MGKAVDYGFTTEDFVAAWQSATSVKKVAERLSAATGNEVPLKTLYSRAAALRKQGVELKLMRRAAVAVAETD